MQPTDFHPSDQELLMAADGELRTEQARRIEAHLRSCWACRARQQEIESAIIDFVSFQRRTLNPPLPPAAGPRALLQARLAELGATKPEPTPRKFQIFGRHFLAQLGAAAVLIPVAVFFLVQTAPVFVRHRANAAPILPRASLTPGVARTAARHDVCTTPAPNNRIVPGSLQHQVFSAYGIVGNDPRAYEVDYLITPALGGAEDVRNLWPQSYAGTVWNAASKDALEEHLRNLVCAGKVDLATAQHDMAADWVSAYKKYFHTDQPSRPGPQ